MIKHSTYKFLAVLLMLLIYSSGFAQPGTPAFYNVNTTPGSANSFPLNSTTSNKVQWIYGPNLFNANGTGVGAAAYAGNITKVYFMIASTASASTYSNFTIKLGQNVGTQTTWTSTTYATGLTTCFYASSFTLTGATTNTWYGVTLQTPFYYNPNLSLVFEMQVSAGTGNTMAQNGSASQRIWGPYNAATGSGFGSGLVDFGFNLASAANNDVGVLSIDSPTTFCTPVQNVVARVKNYGRNQVTGLNVNWSLNGVTQTPVYYPGTIDTVGGANNTRQVLLGSNTFSTTPTAIKAWTSSPNGVTDTVRINDTAYASKSLAISGAYTIDPNGTGSNNFTSFAAAVNAMGVGGICGPVTFTVAAGTYTEKVTLSSVLGASSVNTITFDGVDPTTRILQYNETGTPSNPGVFNILNTSYVTVKNLGIKALGTSTSVGINVQGSNYCFISKNIVSVNTTSTSSYCYGIGQCGATFSSATNAIGNRYENNTIDGGYAGASLYSSSAAGSYDNVFRGNVITNVYYTGLYTYYQGNDSVMDNSVTFRTGGSSYGMFIYYSNNFHVERNIVNNASYCAYYVYSSGASNTNPTFMNNIGICSGTYGTYCLYNDNIRFYHNTFYYTGNTYCAYIGYGVNQRVKNNIFYTTGTSAYALYAITTTGNFAEFDYNIMYAPLSTNYAYWASSAYTSLATLKAAAPGYHTKSLSVMPNFVSTGTPLDLHVTNIVPPFTGDNTVNVTLDVDKEARCVMAPTIGADESKFNSTAPVAGFTAPDSIFVNSPTTIFNNNAASDPLMNYWYLDGVLMATTFNFSNIFTATGTYTVKIVTVGCYGIDSMTKVVTVYNPTMKPIPNFISDVNVVETYVPVQFTDLSTKGPSYWYWTITPSTGVSFNGGTSNLSQNPSVSFANPGLYTVCLRDSNAVGMSAPTCKTAYILVRATNQMCIYPFDTRVATGTLYDDGGPAGNYGANHTATNPCTFLIDPCASKVKLLFSEFNLGTGAYLKVYDGKDKFGVPLFTGSGWTGTTIPGDTAGLVANSGKMYIEFITASTLAAGFKAVWTSTPGTYVAPAGNLTEPDTVYDCGGLFDLNFNSNTAGFVKDEANYKWYFDWANSQSFPDIEGKAYYNAQWSYSTTGTYIIRLDVEGCGGTLTIYDTIVVVSTPSKPVVNFTADYTNATIGDVITLTDKSLYGPTWWRWKITGPGTTSTVSGNSSSKTWSLRFGSVGTYTVQLIDSNCIGSDSLTKTGYINIVNYCTPAVSTLNPDFAISRVQVGRTDTLIGGTIIGIDYTNTTPAPGTVAYRNNTSVTKTYYVGSSSVTKALEAIVSLGGNYTFSISRPSNYNPANINIWVDYNQDGTFQPTELVASSGQITGTTFSGSFTVPTTVPTGYTRMRIGTAFANLSNTPCGANIYGEFNDYRVKVTPDQVTPTITFTGPDTVGVEVGRIFTDPGFSVTDNVTNPTPYTVTGIASGTQITKYPFTASYVVKATDAAGNSASRTRVVVATPDVTKPVITLIGASTQYVEVKTSYTDSGATASDFYFGNFTPYMSTSSTVNINKIGTYTVKYDVTDSSGNAAITAVRTVIVRDTQKPVISVSGTNPLYINVFGTFTPPTVTVTDNYNTGLSYTMTGGPVMTNVVGTYTLTYNATDSSGNAATPFVLTVIVRDVTAPSISLFLTDTTIIDVNTLTSVPEPGYSMSDNYYSTGALTLVIDYSVVKLNQLGVYAVRYKISDPSGNMDSSKVRIYKVVDRIAPDMTLKGSSYMIWPRWKPFVDPGVTITDNYYTGLTATVDLSKLDIYLPGVYEITYSVTDGSGNKATDVKRIVEIVTPNGISGSTSQNGFNVYPNPSKGVFAVDLNLEGVNDAVIQIFSAEGKLVKTLDKVSAINNTITIDMSGASNGMYFVHVSGSNYSNTKSISIQR